jgi:hypothetical protein
MPPGLTPVADVSGSAPRRTCRTRTAAAARGVGPEPSSGSLAWLVEQDSARKTLAPPSDKCDDCAELDPAACS